jgi:glucokinase
MSKKRKPLMIGVDLGGTSIQAAAVRDGRVLASAWTQTKAERGVAAVVERVEKTVRKVMTKVNGNGSDFAGLGVGAPGAVDTVAGVVRNAPNLEWKNVALADDLSGRLGLPVVIDNDVNVGVVGEHVYGAGRGARNLVGIFVGTGIGGGIILNGLPYLGARGVAGEVGHMIVEPRGRRCECGQRGCVEAYASKTAMEKMLREAHKKRHRSLAYDLMKKNGRRLTSSIIAEALKAKDARMKEILETSQYYLGLLTANLVNCLDPELVVFGGGVVERLGRSFVGSIARTASKHYLVKNSRQRTRVVPAMLGDDAGPIGAAVVAQRRLEGATL